MKSIVFITAISGSGRTTAVQKLIEEGYVVLENFEAYLIEETLKVLIKSDEASKIAIVIKAKDENKVKQVMFFLKKYEKEYIVRKILLTCNDNTLINRYQEKRKLHPLIKEGKVSTLVEAIDFEKNIEEQIKYEFDKQIDTSTLSVRDMQSYLNTYINTGNDEIKVIFQSFGFKHGLPSDSDNVIDVRHLPNPFYEEDLRKKTGLQSEVQNYVLSFDESKELLQSIINFIELQIAGYKKEKRLFVTFSIGCTGGQHRSVTFVEKLNKYFKNSEVKHLEGDRGNWHL